MRRRQTTPDVPSFSRNRLCGGTKWQRKRTCHLAGIRTQKSRASSDIGMVRRGLRRPPPSASRSIRHPNPSRLLRRRLAREPRREAKAAKAYAKAKRPFYLKKRWWLAGARGRPHRDRLGDQFVVEEQQHGLVLDESRRSCARSFLQQNRPLASTSDLKITVFAEKNPQPPVNPVSDAAHR